MIQKILYLECNSGISGDMTVSALLDLGASEERLRSELAKLPVDGYELKVEQTKKCGISCLRFHVLLKEEHHHHHHENEHRLHHHHHRTYKDIQEMIEGSKLQKAIKEKSQKIFYILAKAEAAVHGTTIEAVHFHEVGAVDSIVDIVGAAICLVDLGIEEIAISPLTEGCGTVWCQHGEIPVPVPAVLKLAETHGLPIKKTDIQGEMITPTGAAIVAAMRTRELPEEFIIQKTGIGAGTKDFPHANILRAMLITPQYPADSIWVLETNVDDFSGEQLGFLQEKLMHSGAKDVFFTPIYMKKSRPAYKLTVLCDSAITDQIENLIFQESTSIGIRRYPANRTVLERRIEKISTNLGDALVKVCTYGGKTFCYPEYESIRTIGKKSNKSYHEIYNTIKGKAEENLGG